MRLVLVADQDKIDMCFKQLVAQKSPTVPCPGLAILDCRRNDICSGVLSKSLRCSTQALKVDTINTQELLDNVQAAPPPPPH